MDVMNFNQNPAFNMYGSVPVPTMAGYNYTGVAPVKRQNNLTNEQIETLMSKKNKFSLAITEEDRLRAGCNHRKPDGMGDAIVTDPISGACTCTICGYTFKPTTDDLSPEAIQEAQDKILDILQTIKIMYVDMPPAAAMEYFQIIPLIEKIKDLYQYAAKNMLKHNPNAWQYSDRNMGTMAMFNQLQSMFGSGFIPQPQQAMQQPYGMPQQPYGMPPYGMPQQPSFGQPPYGAAPQANPFGYAGASQQGYNPQTMAGYSYNPAQAAPGAVTPSTQNPQAAQPSANDAGTTTTTQKVNL